MRTVWKEMQNCERWLSPDSR